MNTHWTRRNRKNAAIVRRANEDRVTRERLATLDRMGCGGHPYVPQQVRNHPAYRQLESLTDDPGIAGIQFLAEIQPHRLTKKRPEHGATRRYMLQQRIKKQLATHALRASEVVDIRTGVADYLHQLEQERLEREELASEYEAGLRSLFALDDVEEYTWVTLPDGDYRRVPNRELATCPYPVADDGFDDELAYGHDWWTYEPIPHPPGRPVHGCGCGDCIPRMRAIPVYAELIAPEIVLAPLMGADCVLDETDLPRDRFRLTGQPVYDATKSRTQRRMDHQHDRIVDLLLATH